MENQVPSAPSSESFASKSSVQPVPPTVPAGASVHHNATKDKFPDPLDKNLPAVVTNLGVGNSTQEVTTLVNKRFWRTVLIFLVLLPVLTAISVFGYQAYTNLTSGSETTITPAIPTINPEQVVTPEMLPLASSSAQLLPGWVRYTHPSSGYSFQYPEGWFLIDSDINQIKIQSFDPKLSSNDSSVSEVNTMSMEFDLLALKTQLANKDQLIEFVKTQDQQEALRITVATDSAELSDSGVEIYQRRVNKGTSFVNYPEAYVILDKNVLRVSITGGTTNNPSIFNQIIKTLKVNQIDQSSLTSEWKVYESTHGYSLRYPASLILKSNDKTDPGMGDVTKALSVTLFSAKDLQNLNGLENTLTLQLSEAEPTQTATQAATRDFGTREFKLFQSDGQFQYVGQLSSGNWLDITLTYDSNVDQRIILGQVVDTLLLKEPALP